ncbi:MAG: hypothetical protein AUJ85_03285 [Elusimicrobia bacterium CG1_02_37_114]|nr:MAG: hypothetical protein AUJ85_03285 [Elusimicrobia bacterium CG1_02_37_114]PIV54119.1 MAG: hypothetical protein COS17_00250 [Elusimicrobia bacterium CG02_land_8_20_14_3_00_37_13]
MRKKLMLFFLSMSLVTQAGMVWSKGAGSSAGYILTRTVSARAGGLADALGAVNNDVCGLHYNPAGIATLTSQQISLMSNRGIADDNFIALIYGHPSEKLSLGVSVIYYDAGTLEFYDSNLILRTKCAEKDVSAGLSIGKTVAQNLHAGGNLKFLSSTLVEDKTATALAIDLGLLYSINGGLTLGLSGLNIGSGLKYIKETDPLPTTIRGSVAYHLTNQLLLVGDDSYLVNEGQLVPAVGCEYEFNMFHIRTGYKFSSDTQGLNIGIGFNRKNFGVDYAFGLVNSLSNEHTISLKMAWGGIPESVKEKKVIEIEKKPVRKKSERTEKINIAVADFSGQNVSAADASIVAGFLRTELVNTGAFNVMDRANMEMVLAEQKFQLSGCTSEECAVKMGKLLNVQHMMVGSLSKLLDTYYITVNVVDVETGKILKSSDQKAMNADELRSACKILAGKLSEE